jgi:hypothetical protein
VIIGEWQGKKIEVVPTHGPRSHQFEAFLEGTLDADYDYESGRYVATYKRGFGETEREALRELIDVLEDSKEAQP